MANYLVKNSLPTTILLGILLMVAACKSKQEAPVSILDQPAARYIAAYTDGVIGRTESVRVQFVDAAVTAAELSSPPPADLLQFSPAASGTLVWEDVYTLRFTPDEPLTPGTTYTASVALDQVVADVASDARVFQFLFQVKEQQLSVVVDPLSYPDPDQLAAPVLTGAVYTHDVADPGQVEALIAARQANRQLTVEWMPSEEPRTFAFQIQGVERGESASTVQISWDGEAIAAVGPGNSGEKEVSIPALGDFLVLEVAARSVPDQHLAVVFSDPIDPAQNLDGFFRFSEQTVSLRPIVRGNTVRLYPGGEVASPATLIVSAGIRNTAGKALPQRTTWEVNISEAQPELRAISEGTILPDGDQKMLFPFEAIGIRTVEVEIFKVFQNNLVQYFQQNSLADAYDLQQVGRVVLRKRIDLATLVPGATVNNWTRYALDLRPLIGEDRQSIYQVRIGFRPSDVTLACQSEATYEPEERIEIGFSEETSILDDYYGIEGYYPEYSYRDRDDPCKPAYYNSSRFIRSNVLVSNIGLIAKRSGDRKTTVIVTDLLGAQPVSGARVELYDYQQQLLTTAQTDANGVARVSTEREPFLVVAHRGNDHNYLRMRGGEMLSLSRFPTDGVAAATGLKGYLYGERGVWRPGDSVYLNFILEDREGHLPADYPAVFTLRDARGQTRVERTVRPALGRFYPLHFATDADDPTGFWYAAVEVGGKTFTKSLRIETIKPNRIKVDLEPPASGLRPGAQALRVKADWLYGAPAAGLRTRVEASFSEDRSGFEGYAEYAFNDPARNLNTQPFVAFEGTLDAAGTTVFQLEAPQTEGAPGPLQLGIQTRVFEPGGDFSTDNQRLPYSPYAAYAGVRLPKNDWGESSLILERENAVSVVVVDADGKPLANRSLSLGLYQVEWRWWWDDGRDNVSQYNSSSHHNAFKRTTLTTNSQGEATWPVEIAQWGRYLVRVCDTAGGHCAGAYAYAGSPWSASEEMDRSQAAMLRLRTDQEEYAPGATAEVLFNSPVSGRALISLESASAVQQTLWYDVVAGENRLPIDLTEAMSPNVYANVQLLQPHRQTTNGLPIRLYGVVPITVTVPERRLEPRVATAETWAPDSEVTVAVSEASGRAMNYTLAIVDEGLLSLTRFATPDAYEHFYAKEALGVDTWDVYNDVLGAFGGQVERVLAIGGDGENARNPDADRANRFEPVVRHLGPFRLPAGETVTHRIDLPNYIGAVRVMVVAEADRAYGSAEKSVPVRKPLMLLATLPRVLGPGEELSLPVNVFAMTAQIRNVRVSVSESSGLVSFPEESVRRLTFSSPGDALVRIPLRVGNAVGIARFEILAEGNGESITQEIEIDVRNPNPLQFRVANSAIDVGATANLSYEHFGVAGTRSATLEISALPPLELEKRLKYLLRYPYGCVEQAVSAVFPQLYLDRFVELSELQRETREANVESAIRKLLRYQGPSGGMQYWPGGQENEWGSSYAAHFLLEAKARGYAIPITLLDRLLDYQRARARGWQPRTEYYATESQSILDQAYRLYTLALSREPDLGAMNQLRARRDLSPAARWRLAAAYAQAGKAAVASDLIDAVATQVSDYRELSYTFGSALRDEAMILEALVAIGAADAANEQALYIARQFQERDWLSTQEASFGLLALGKWLGDREAGSPLRINYTDPQGRQSAAGTDQAILRIALPDAAGVQSLRVENTSGGPLFATLTVAGQPAISTEAAASRNLQLNIRYLDLNGDPIEVSSLRQGTDFLAEATVIHPGSRNDYYRELALQQVFPSGWEISNERMTAVGASGSDGAYTYRDYRDDRVQTYFDLATLQKRTYRVRLTAAYAGRFYLPAHTAEAMYDRDIYAATTGQWVTVIPVE
jgi:uncharacterized protein YfaS (alpha-2-macroglobulin family)